MADFNFEKLIVYQKSIELSVILTKIASRFPYKFKRIQDQLIGAAISIPLNIAEGSGRYNPKEKQQFYKIAQASAFELIAVLDICDGLNLLKRSEWDETITEICKMLSVLIRPKLKTKN